MTTDVVQFSGGVSSWAAARVIRDAHPDHRMILLFADTLIEDEDTYRFLDAAAADIGEPVTRIAVGLTPWEVFKKSRMLGNTRADPCSAQLKRVPLRRWIEENTDPADTVIHLGIDYTEAHRLDRARPRWLPWRVEAPLIDAGLDKPATQQMARERGLPEQRLYRWGMAHANCGGGCVKAGRGHFAKLLAVFPERYAEWEANEADVAAHIGKPVAILRDRTGGQTRPMTLAEFRTRLEAEDTLPLDFDDIGGCGCALD